MEIPNRELYPSRITSYGGGSFELTPGVEEAGCPRLYRKKYVDRVNVVEFSERLQFGGAVHKALDHAFKNDMPPTVALMEIWPDVLGPDLYAEAHGDLVVFENRDEPYLTLATEVKLTAPLPNSTIKLAGYLDRIAIDPSEPNTLIVEDYKTNQFPPSKLDVDRWIQGKTYAALARHNAAKYGMENPRIVARFHAMKWHPIETVWSDHELDTFEAWAAAIGRKIEQDEVGNPRVNPGCSWCPYKGRCAAFKALPQKGSMTVLDRKAQEPLEVRAAFLLEAKEAVRHLGAYVKDTEEAIKEKIRVEEQPYNTGDGFEYRLKPGNRRVVTDPMRLHEIMGDDYYVAKPRLGDLDKWMAAHPEDEAAIKSTIDEESSGGTLRRVLETKDE